MYRTLLGSALSVITLALMITYASFKASELLGMHEYTVQTKEMLELYEVEQKFGASDGFIVAGTVYSFS